MYVLGLGVPFPLWKSLLLQINAVQESHQCLATFGISLEFSDQLFQRLKILLQVGTQPPSMIFFYLPAFSDAHEVSQSFSILEQGSHRITWILDSDLQTLHKIPALPMSLKLRNKMTISIDDPSALQSKALRSFPRLLLDLQLSIRFQDAQQQTQEITLADLPETKLIALKNISKVKTHFGWLDAKVWLAQFMATLEKKVDIATIYGILREKHTVSFFPGVPISAVDKVSFKTIEIAFCMNERLFLKKNQKLTELLNFIHQQTPKMKPLSKLPNTVVCVSDFPVLNQSMASLLKLLGCPQVFQNSFSLANPSDVPEKATYFLLNVPFKPQWKNKIYDFTKLINNSYQMLESAMPLKHLQPIHQPLPPLNRSPKVLRQHFQTLLLEKKELLKKTGILKNSLLLLEQEQQVFQKISQTAQKIKKYLQSSLKWDEVLYHEKEIPNCYTLLLCDDEGLAMDLHSRLSKVDKKIWINLNPLQHPEDLVHLDLEIFNEAQALNLIIPKHESQSLELLCSQALEKKQSLQKQVKEQHEQLFQKEEEFYFFEFCINAIALEWIMVHVYQILQKRFG